MSIMGMIQQNKNVQALKSLPVLMQYMGKFSKYKLHTNIIYSIPMYGHIIEFAKRLHQGS